MTNALLQSLLKSTGALCVLLMVGMFLRAKVPFFRKSLIPASILGGFLGLVLGPQVMGEKAVLRFSEEWITTWSLLPSILIVPVFAAIPLGKFRKPGEKGQNSRQEISKVTIVSGIASGAFGIQIVIGVGLALLMAKLIPSMKLYNNFGYEICQGFNGGHSMSGAIGNILMEGGIGHWEVAQGVVTTYATIGLLGGLLLGVFFINRAARKGQTALLKEAGSLSDSATYGYSKNIEEQESMGRATTTSSSIETLTVHMAIILGDCLLAYWLRGLAVKYHVIGFQDIPVWPYALILMYGVNYLLQRFHLEWLIDEKVKSHLSGACSDIAIAAAIVSMPIKAVMTYMLPIVIISAVGFVAVYFTTVKMFQLLMPDSFPFERGILSFGINTGVMLTGMTLLKICDPDFETPVMTDYSFSYAIRQVIELISTPIMYGILVKGTSMQMLMFGVIYTVLCYIIVAVGKLMYKKEGAVQADVVVQNANA